VKSGSDLESNLPVLKESKVDSMYPTTVVSNIAAKKRGNRILCRGKCVTGPSHGGWSPFAVLVLITGGTLAIGFFTFSEIFAEEERLLSIATLFTFTTLLGIWTIVSMLMVQYSDPGIVT